MATGTKIELSSKASTLTTRRPPGTHRSWLNGCVAVVFFFVTTIGSLIANAGSPTAGLFFNNPGTSGDFTLFSPNTTTSTYLIDKDGNVANEWQSDYIPGINAYLPEDGSLVRAAAPNGIFGNGSIVANGSGGLTTTPTSIKSCCWCASLASSG